MGEQEIVPETGALSAPIAPSTFFSQRSLSQFGWFVAGAGSFALSMVFTRRVIAQRYRNNIPKYFHHSNHGNADVNGATEALVALNLATINVCTAGLMSTGGILWALDISSLDDLKSKVRRNQKFEQMLINQEDSEEIESWIATLLSRKEFRALRKENDISEEKLLAMIKNKSQRKDNETSKETAKS